MKRMLALLLLAPGAALSSGIAPFCVFSSGPPQCFYYDIQSCRGAARTFNGMCAPNPTPQTQIAPIQQQPVQPIAPQIDRPNFMESFYRGQQAGQEARMREEQIKLIKLQQEAAAEQMHGSKGQREVVTYECRADDGTVWETYEAYVGCVVIRVSP
jgi:hypothetical protein